MAQFGDKTNGSSAPKSADTSQGRLPPQAVEIEMSVLGAMLLQQDVATKAIEVLEHDSFYKEAHRLIFIAMKDLYVRSEPIDHISVTEELRRRGQLEQIGTAYYLTELSQQVTSPANIETHCRIILEKSLARQLIETSTSIISDAYADSMDAFDLIDSAETRIFQISERHMKRSYVSMDKAVDDVMHLIDKIQKQDSGITGVPTGYSALDQKTGGFQPSDLIILAARPSIGKTALALSIARNVSIEKNIPVAVFSLEMSVTQLVLRLLCAEARVNMHEVRTGTLPDDEWSRFSKIFGKLASAHMYIDDTPSLSIVELRAKARRLVDEHQIGLIVVDYLQLMHGPRTMESREREISTISRSLKALAKDLNIPILALSQLNRGVEQRQDKRPQLSDLRESGSIEQDADVVLFIHRDKENEPGMPQEDQGKATIIIGKQRNGPTGEIELAFVQRFARFENLESRFPETFLPPTGGGNIIPF